MLTPEEGHGHVTLEGDGEGHFTLAICEETYEDFLQADISRVATSGQGMDVIAFILNCKVRMALAGNQEVLLIGDVEDETKAAETNVFIVGEVSACENGLEVHGSKEVSVAKQNVVAAVPDLKDTHGGREDNVTCLKGGLPIGVLKINVSTVIKVDDKKDNDSMSGLNYLRRNSRASIAVSVADEVNLEGIFILDGHDLPFLNHKKATKVTVFIIVLGSAKVLVIGLPLRMTTILSVHGIDDNFVNFDGENSIIENLHIKTPCKGIGRMDGQNGRNMRVLCVGLTKAKEN